jgi:sugar lactone lactonase YvrE
VDRDVGRLAAAAVQPCRAAAEPDRDAGVPAELPAFAGGTQLAITSARAGLTETDLARQPLAGSVFVADVGVRAVPVGRFGESWEPDSGPQSKGVL